ncbi:MAG: hypothetical protein CL983_04770 [Euryarchaeota archaeon]|nr:hypothetical protein [Euryarchaeota archaeon]|tara:strand:- start:2897 stop:4102 length:1206 start_codon:yes stop_codon:yes gene_type:complete
MMKEVDILVIGAGPIGGYFSKKMAELGCKVLMIEEHMEIGKPFQCAGLVNPSSMEKVGLYDTVLSEIDGAVMHSPFGTTIEIGKPNQIRTYAVCRKKFDQAIVQQAMDEGAELWLNSKPTDTTNFEDSIITELLVDGKITEVKSKLLVGADGAHSWVRRQHRMGYPKEFMIGYQVEVTGFKTKNRMLEMFTGDDIAPGFFAWAIPNGDTHRIGMWSRAEDLDGRSCEELLNNLMTKSRWAYKFEDCKEIGRFCGPIPAGVVPRPVQDRVLLIGDAAGLAKPTTGGGIGPGMAQVDLIVDELNKMILKNKLAKNVLIKVTKKYAKAKKEFERIRSLRDFFVSSRSDEELEEIFKIFSKPEVIRLINEKGDIEKPLALGISMLKNVPEFRKMAIKAGFIVMFT